MKKTIKISGMMCEHCEKSVKECLEAINGVISAEVSKDSGTAVIDMTCDVDDAIITEAIESIGFEVN